MTRVRAKNFDGINYGFRLALSILHADNMEIKDGKYAALTFKNCDTE